MRFAERLSEKSKKTNNHPGARRAKAEIRRNVLEAIGADRAFVFDGFAGDGEMWRMVWREAKGYVGCDLEWYPDDRLAYVCDNRRLLRAIDLRAFNVFDFDAYGSPWEQCAIVAALRPLGPGGRLGFCITEGSGFNLKLGGMPKALRYLAGFRGTLAGGGRHQDKLIDMAIAGLAVRLRASVVARWQAIRKGGAGMRYIGLVVEGRRD